MKLRFAAFALPVLATIITGSNAAAATLYGVSASGQANYSVQTASGNPLAFTNSYTTNMLLPQTSYTQAANYGGQTSGSGNSASAFVTVQNSSYGQLHEGVSASSNNPASGGGATTSAFLQWQDTITFIGAPANTPVTVQLTNVFDGTLSITGNVASGTGLTVAADLLGGSNTLALSNNYTTSQPALNVTQTGLVSTTVGSTLTLQESLSEYLSGTGLFSGVIDLSNTSSVYLTVLTPGVSIVSASGASYSLPAVPTSGVPEPASFLLIGSGLAAVAVLGKKRIKR